MNIRFCVISLLFTGAANYAMVDTGRAALRFAKQLAPRALARNYSGIGNGCTNCICNRDEARILHDLKAAQNASTEQEVDNIRKNVKNRQEALGQRGNYYKPCKDKRTLAYNQAWFVEKC